MLLYGFLMGSSWVCNGSVMVFKLFRNGFVISYQWVCDGVVMGLYWVLDWFGRLCRKGASSNNGVPNLMRVFLYTLIYIYIYIY